MSDDGTEIITGEQLAGLLQVSPRTVEEWRRTRTGPPWRRMGRHVRYLRREVSPGSRTWAPMTNARLRAGQLGTVSYLDLPSGRIQARALLCDELGVTQRLKASGKTTEEARRALLARAEAVRLASGGPTLGMDSTVAEVAAVFLADKRQSGTVVGSTLDSYESTVRLVVIPTCGQLLLRDLTVRRCNRVLADIKASMSLSAARRARSVLSQVCSTGIEWEILAFNPVRDARRLPLPEKKTAVLTPQQLVLVQTLIRSWRAGTDHAGPSPRVDVLEHAMWIMVGTSVRVGEVLALRRCDVDITANPPTALVDATLTYDRENGSQRKPAPKRTRQRRRIALPAFTAAAVRRQLADTPSDPNAYLFATSTGRPLSVSNYERLLRTFIDDNEQALRLAGISTELFSTHIFRRSTATIVEAAAGITVASRMLGHSNEQVTRASYVVSAEQVDPITAEIMDDAFTGLVCACSVRARSALLIRAGQRAVRVYSRVYRRVYRGWGGVTRPQSG